MSEGERIASLEAHADDTDRRIDGNEAAWISIAKDVHEIKEAMSKYRGFVAGAWFVLAILGGLVGAGVTAAWHRIMQ